MVRSSIIKFTSIILILVATIPHIIVTLVVGPANLAYSLSITTFVMALLARTYSPTVAGTIILTGGLLQFFTPVPFWVCVDGGYKFCPWIVADAWQNSERYNVVDAIILSICILGYTLWYIGWRTTRKIA